MNKFIPFERCITPNKFLDLQITYNHGEQLVRLLTTDHLPYFK